MDFPFTLIKLNVLPEPRETLVRSRPKMQHPESCLYSAYSDDRPTFGDTLKCSIVKNVDGMGSEQQNMVHDLSQKPVIDAECAHALIFMVLEAHYYGRQILLRHVDIWLAIILQLRLYLHNSPNFEHQLMQSDGPAVRESCVLIQITEEVDEFPLQVLRMLLDIFKSEVAELLLPKFEDNGRHVDWAVHAMALLAKPDTRQPSPFTLQYLAEQPKGIYSVVLQGPRQDWVDLKGMLTKLKDLVPSSEPKLLEYLDRLTPIMDGLINSVDAPEHSDVRSFWQSMIGADKVYRPASVNGPKVVLSGVWKFSEFTPFVLNNTSCSTSGVLLQTLYPSLLIWKKYANSEIIQWLTEFSRFGRDGTDVLLSHADMKMSLNPQESVLPECLLDGALGKVLFDHLDVDAMAPGALIWDASVGLPVDGPQQGNVPEVNVLDGKAVAGFVRSRVAMQGVRNRRVFALLLAWFVVEYKQEGRHFI